MPQQDVWTDEKFWAQPGWRDVRLKDQWDAAVKRLADFFEAESLTDLEQSPTVLAEAWMRQAVENYQSLYGAEAFEGINAASAQISGSTDEIISRVIHIWDLLGVKAKLALKN